MVTTVILPVALCSNIDRMRICLNSHHTIINVLYEMSQNRPSTYIQIVTQFYMCSHNCCILYSISCICTQISHAVIFVLLFYILLKCQLRAHQESKGGTLTMLPLYSHHKEKLMVMTHIGNTQDCSQTIEKTKNNQKNQRGHQKAQQNHWENQKEN